VCVLWGGIARTDSLSQCPTHTPTQHRKLNQRPPNHIGTYLHTYERAYLFRSLKPSQTPTLHRIGVGTHLRCRNEKFIALKKTDIGQLVVLIDQTCHKTNFSVTGQKRRVFRKNVIRQFAVSLDTFRAIPPIFLCVDWKKFV